MLLALRDSLLGGCLISSDKVGGGRLVLILENAGDDIAHTEVAASNAGLQDPSPALLVGLDLVAVAHLLEEIHHSAEL